MKNRYDIMAFISVTRSLLQGNTEDNEPRIDLETQQGLYTPMGYKRQVRDYLTEAYGMPMWIARKANLAEEPLSLAKKLGLQLPTKGAVRLTSEQEAQLIKALAEARYDFRAFGGVLTSFNLGVKGPVQFNLAETVDPITIQRLGVTRCAVASEEESKTKDKTMGEFAVVPYGLYRSLVSVSPSQAQRTGFNENDLSLLLEAMLRCFEISASTLRSNVSVPVIYVFKHDSKLGNMPRHKLFERVQLTSDGHPHAFKDYTIKTDFEDLDGVEVFKIETMEDLIKAFPKKKSAA